MHKPFVHLHVHSHYSLLDGMATIPGLVDKAIDDGMKAIALTDHGNMFGVKEFFNYVTKKNKGKEGEARFKPIIGVEAYCARRDRFKRDQKEDGSGWHLILLAKNKKGYQNLCKMVSKSWTEGFYYKPRIDKDLLKKYHEGLIVCSACLGGEIPQKLMGKNAKNVEDEDIPGTPDNSSINDPSTSISNSQLDIAENNKQEAEQAVRWFKDLFGDDYYLEIQRHKTDKPNADYDTYKRQKEVNTAILELAKKTDTKVIASNDVHFIDEEHADAHDRLICLSTSKDLDDPKRMRYTKQEWLKTRQEMHDLFADLPETLANTEEIAEKVEFYSINSDALMPNYEIPTDFGTVEEYKTKFTENDLRQEFGERYDALAQKGLDKLYRIKLEADYLELLTMKGAHERYGETPDQEVMERIKFELDTMKTMGFPGYFLIVQDFINAGRENGISFGPGRGSAAGSVVAYCLKITDIDPLKYDLLFERFLNPDRISMPDIDVDIEADGRSKVLQWVTEKYGAEKVARIITYGTMAAKSSIKDVARVHKLPLQEADRLAKYIPEKLPEENGKAPEVNLHNCISRVQELREARNSSDELIADTLKYAEMLEGTVRQTGVHACGVIIGADDLSNHVPLSTADDKDTKEKVTVTQYEGGVIEEVGLIKMDFLGLETLDIIKEALKKIKNSKGIDLDIASIPLDDEKTYELFSEGQTVGVFQFESAGMQKYLRELHPSCLGDLIAMNALYRPGPIQYIPSFIKRKNGEEKITYDIPEMEKRLRETYGVTVYQEQVMLLSRDLAGFTRGQSDELRKAMGKKLVEKMASLKEKFLTGGIKNGHDEKTLQKIWDDWSEFAKYAFNKSHSTCYAWVAYQTGYLKAHYPSEYMAALLTRNLSNSGEIMKYMDECRSMRINVKGPDINESGLDFVVTPSGDIRFGLGGVKNVGVSAVEAIVNERKANGPFTSIFDFMERVNLNACNKRAIEALCCAGAFDNFSEITREQFMQTVSKNETFTDVLIRYGNKFQTDRQTNTNSLFGESSEVSITHPEIPKCEAWTNIERLKKEKELIGIYLSSHPLDDYYIVFNHVIKTKLSEFKNLITKENLNREIMIGGIVTNYKTGTTKSNQPYGIIRLEDYEGSGEVALFGKDFFDFGKYGVNNATLLVRGRIQLRKKYRQEDPDVVEFKIASIEPMSKERADSLVNKMTLVLPLNKINDELIAELSSRIKNNPGACSLFFRIEDMEQQKISVSLHAEMYKFSISRKLITFLEDNNIDFIIN